MADTELTRTVGSTTNRKTFTFSVWFKRSKITSGYPRIAACDYADSDRFELQITNTDNLRIEHVANGSADVSITTNRKFKDTNAWYHLVVAFDTTQATTADRVKIYINGVQETSFSSSTYPSQNSNMIVNYASGSVFYIGETGYSSGGQNFDGLMSHFHFIDGTAYDADTFGETDSTTGQWKIKTNPSVTYGNNGFFLFKDDNSVNDQSGNGNNFTVAGGTLTQTEDNPSNVFATWNPLMTNTASDYAFSYGNTKVSPQTNGSYNHGISTLGMKKGDGKYYCEIKWHVNDNVGSAGIIESNIANHAWNDNININDHTVQTSWGRCVFRDDGNIKYGGTNTSSGVSMTNNDILGIAFDAENGKVYFHVNGTYVTTNSVQHNPSSGTGGIDISGHSSWVDGSFWHWYCGDGSSSGYSNYSLNAGNGYFESTAITSEGTNASGIGKFEYDVPTGFTALCTKGLNE